jgi:hypothetical protein
MNLQKDLKEFVELLIELDVTRELGKLGEFDCSVYFPRHAQKNKAASGRSQDLADLEHL